MVFLKARNKLAYWSKTHACIKFYLRLQTIIALFPLVQ